MIRPSLRTQVTAVFAAGALLVSAAVALLSYQLTERYLLGERERSSLRSAYLDARIVQAGLTGDRPDIVALLRSLDTGGNRRVMLRRDGQWYSRTADAGLRDAFPAGLHQITASGGVAVQRIRTANGPALAIGMPLDSGATLYEIDFMVELDRSLKILASILTLVAALTTIAGAAVGWYAARYVTRPLRRVVKAARDIADGDLSARLDSAAEPEVKELATAFNQMVGQLATRMERDRRFAADVSHELRSPLQTLAAAASVLDRRKDQLDERSATAARLITEELGRFQDLLADLIELARSDQPPEFEPVDIAALAAQVCRTQGHPEHIITVSPGTATVWPVDRRRFTQVLANLLHNAACHGGGPTAVRIRQTSTHHVIDVEDDGPGVAPDDRELIFGRFVRGRAATARSDNDGTGLGLALVAQHIRAHGGQVTVGTPPGGGARFTIELPGENT